MTTNPEQADTVPPEICDHLIATDAVRDLCDTIDSLCADLATARRQRDERPAGRILWQGETRAFSEIDADRHLSDWSWVPDEDINVPPGTEVAVVVVADDSGVGK